MVAMTKAQAKKRLKEAKKKVQSVYLFQNFNAPHPVQSQDLVAIEKILNKCINRIK